MEFLINDQLKFLIGWNRKCACGTIKKWFADLSNISIDSNPHQFFRQNKMWTSIDNEKDYTSYKKIIVIRNPYVRLVSGYTDKFIFSIKFKKHGENFFQFVSALEQNTSIGQRHFEPQTCCDFERAKLLGWQWDRAIDIDSLNDALAEIAQGFGRSIEIGNLGKRALSRQKYDDVEQKAYLMSVEDLRKTNPIHEYYYNDALKRKVQQIYKSDFGFFSKLGFHYDV